MLGSKFGIISIEILASLFISLGLVSCGGSGSNGGDTGGTSNATGSGQFIDSAVAGLSYFCSSGISDITDTRGSYTCAAGDTVTFSINGYVIGSAIASGVITPETLTSDSAQQLNIAQLLQTLDTDNDPTNGISIAQSGTQYDAMARLASDNVALDLADFDTTVATYLGETLVDETTAQTHLNDSIASITFDAASIQAALSGKTVYPPNTPPYTEEWVMSADGMTADGSGVDQYGAYAGTLTFSYTDTSFTVTSSDPTDSPVTFTISEITDTYIQTDLGRLSLTQAAASPFTATDIQAALAGKTVYPSNTPPYTEEWVMSADGMTADGSGVDQYGAYTGTLTFSYTDTSFTVTSSDPADSPVTFTVSEITDTYIQTDLGKIAQTQAGAYP